MLSSVLRSLHASSPACSYSIIALAYRGYWKSSGQASEHGLNLDAAAATQYASRTFPSTAAEDVKYVLWGHSLGTAVSCEAAARNASNPQSGTPLSAILLETPSYALNAILQAMYPQKWLPYRYLGPLLWNTWDSKDALRRFAQREREREREHEHGEKKRTKILMLQAEKDELIPPEHASVLEAYARSLQLDVSRIVVKGAGHNDIPTKPMGQQAILGLLRQVGES